MGGQQGIGRNLSVSLSVRSRMHTLAVQSIEGCVNPMKGRVEECGHCPIWIAVLNMTGNLLIRLGLSSVIGS